MENIFKISKRGIIVILTLCILLGIAGTGVNVAAMAEETIVYSEATAVATEEITTVVVEETTISTEEPTVAIGETTPELMPMMARGCSNYYYYHRGMDMDAVAAECGWSMNGKYIYQNGVEIGRYDNGSNGQDPHFHLYSTPGVHYILG